MSTPDSLFVPALQPALKHPTILKTFDDLKSGESFLLINDHDPMPLYYEMKAEKGNVFEWSKVEDGPEIWKVKITRTGEKRVAAAGGNASVAPFAEDRQKEANKEIFVLDVTRIEPRLKHPTIFNFFDALKEGEAFQLLNDHDPKPLYYQLLGERGNTFTWSYLEKGPEWWKVVLRKNDPSAAETVGEIAAKDIRKAEVFKKYGIDFCCGGKKSLKEACEEKGIGMAAVEAELANPAQAVQATNDFNRWEPDFLADYIYNQHHLYYYSEVPVITDLLIKVTDHHGGDYPELISLYTQFERLSNELETHFRQEEKEVFPSIKALMLAKKTGSSDAPNNQSLLAESLQAMESDHSAAGAILAEMKKISNDYYPPENACNSYRLLYKKLKELHEDLHQHIHLENNILFPKALQLEKELR